MTDDKEEIWSHLAQGWEKWASYILEPRRELFNKLVEVAEVGSQSVVLDIATGMGEPAMSAANKASAGAVIAVDTSKEMLGIAKARAEKEGISNIRWQQIAAEEEQLPFDCVTFDSVLCCLGLEYLTSLHKSLEEFLRILKPGGAFVVSHWGGKDANQCMTLSTQVLREEFPTFFKRGIDIFHLSNPEPLKNLLGSLGYCNVRSFPFKGFKEFKSFEEYWDMHTQTSPPIAMAIDKMNLDQVNQFRQYLFEKCSPYIKSSGGIVLPFQVNITHALKKSD